MEFAASLRFVCFAGDEAIDAHLSVVLFEAQSWTAAQQAALDIGDRMETTYSNDAGESVAWRLTRVVTLDQLLPSTSDFREVFVLVQPPPADESDPSRIDPRSFVPGQTGV
jgi:hypothetical protein